MGAVAEAWNPDRARMLILADGSLDPFQAKTATGLVRHRADRVVGVLDREHAGGDLAQFLGAGSGIPIVESVDAAKPLNPTAIVIGVATSGGAVPPNLRGHLIDALEAGIDVVSGLHERLEFDEDLSAIARRTGARIHNVRRTNRTFPIASCRTLDCGARRILTVGSDCNVGKMVASLDIARALQSRGVQTEFVATGQTGIMISGRGVCVDAVVSDFIAGAAESLLLECGNCDVIVVEGQGSILHPGFSGVTLGLMHGVLPDAMVLVHQPGRMYFRRTEVPLPPIKDLITLHEAVLRPLHPARVVAVALNCFGLTDEQARREIASMEDEVQLPVTDCVRFGADVLADAVLKDPA